MTKRACVRRGESPYRSAFLRNAGAGTKPHIDREIAAQPELIQIENGWRRPSEQRPGAVQRGTFREIDSEADNPDAEPVAPCTFAKPAIIVHGRRSGQMLTVCTDDHCPIHDPRAAARQAAETVPEMPPAPEQETKEEAEQRKAEHEQRRREYEAEQERRAEERRLEEEREQQEYVAEQARLEEVRKQREATFERLVTNAPKSFTAVQLRILLRALVNLDPYTFTEDVAEDLPEELKGPGLGRVLMAALDATPDSKLTGFAVRFALAAHRGIPRQDEPDFLAEAEAAFTPVPKPEKNRHLRSYPAQGFNSGRSPFARRTRS